MKAMYDLLLALGPQVEPTDDQWIRFRCLLGECDLKRPEAGSVLWQEWVARRAALRGLSAIAQLQGDINQLKSFRKPVLIVTGKNTVSFHRRIDEILAAQCPVAERLELPGNHAAVLAAQDEFLNGLRFWNNIAKNPSSSSYRLNDSIHSPIPASSAIRTLAPGNRLVGKKSRLVVQRLRMPSFHVAV
jgi:hypothetical protein